MNLKRLMSLMLALMLVLSMAACCSGEPAETNPNPVETTVAVESTPAAQQPAETVTVSTVYGDVEVPFAPERICTLDNLTATKEGRLCQIPNSAANSLGLYGVYALLDQLSAFFLG